MKNKEVLQKNKTCLLIMPALYNGGAEKQYRYIISQLEDKGNLFVLILNTPVEEEKKLTDSFIYKHKNVIFHQLNGKVVTLNNKRKLMVYIAKIDTLFKQFVWLNKFLGKQHIDTVMFSYVTQLLMVPLFKKYGVKIIFNERNTGHQICDRGFKRWFLKKCDKVIANSVYASNYINSKTGIKVDIINNGIEEQEINQQKHNMFNILIPARVTPIKNQKIAIEAMKRFSKLNINLILAGNIEDSNYIKELNSTIESAGLNQQVQILGNVQNIISQYKIADLVILPSFEEGTPNVLLESYLFGIMVLASDIPMNRNCCVCSEILFNPKDANELGNKIECAMKDTFKMRRQEILRKNREFVQMNYSMEIMEKKYTNLLYE